MSALESIPEARPEKLMRDAIVTFLVILRALVREDESGYYAPNPWLQALLLR